ncbi:MAG: glycosyltransferase family 4 protein [bacterium]|nr:glycosyltransferase family 4 protein [bacterium]
MGKDILFIVENLSFPFDRRVYREAVTMKQAGYNVSVICPKGRERDNLSFEVIENIDVYRYPLAVDSKSKIDYLIEYSLAIVFTFFLSLKVLAKRNFDIIHVANPPDIFFPILSFYRIVGKKIIFDQHDLTPESYLSRFRDERKNSFYKLQLIFEYLTYKSADAVIATNKTYKEIAQKRGDKKNVFIVRNGPDLRKFHFTQKKDHLKEGFRHMVCYIGIMGVQDGVDYLLRAIDFFVHKLKREDTIFILIGKGDDFEYLKKLALELDLNRYIRFTGRIPDEPAMDYLSTADVAASPDPYNPLNDHSTMNKVMEFMATKNPIVSFNLKEARFSARDSAVYIDDNNTEKFAEAISHLLDSPSLREKMAEIGYKRVQGVLSWEIQEKRLIDLYRKLTY